MKIPKYKRITGAVIMILAVIGFALNNKFDLQILSYCDLVFALGLSWAGIGVIHKELRSVEKE